MDTYVSAKCWNCDTEFTSSDGIAQPLSETFLKRTKVIDRDGEWFKCPVCKYDQGLDMRTIEDGWLQNIWLIRTELVRCGDGNVRPVNNWTRYHDFNNAKTELAHIEKFHLNVKEALVVTVWESFERPVVDEKEIHTITNA